MEKENQSQNEVRFYVEGEVTQVATALSSLYSPRSGRVIDASMNQAQSVLTQDKLDELRGNGTLDAEEYKLLTDELGEKQPLFDGVSSYSAICPPGTTLLEDTLKNLTNVYETPDAHVISYANRPRVVEIIADSSESCPIRPEKMSGLGLKLVSSEEQK